MLLLMFALDFEKFAIYHAIYHVSIINVIL